MNSPRPLVIFGSSSFAQIAALYFGRGAEYRPVAFCVDDEYAMDEEVFGLPLIPLSRLVNEIPPAGVSFHVALTYTRLNRLRSSRVAVLKSLGFSPASYISPHSYVDKTARIGEHVFVFEGNTVQPYSSIGDRVVLWSGNHIGHHSVIEDDVFVSSQVVVSGHCRIGARSFMGVNCSVANNVSIGADNWIQPNAAVFTDTQDDTLWRSTKATAHAVSPTRLFVN